MEAELIAVGNELLGTESLDSNTIFLTRALAAIGIRVARKCTLSDDLAVLAPTLRECCRRSPLVLCTGGLGSTEDDRTTPAAAQALDVDLIRDPEAAARVRDWLAQRQTPLREIDERQAFRLATAQWLPNPLGSAAGQWIPTPAGFLVLLPGPPREMEAMFIQHVRPRLSALLPAQALFTRVLSIVGLAESAVDALAAPLYRECTNPITTILSTAAPSVELHFQATAPTPAEAQARADLLAAAVERRVGEAVFSRERETLAAVVGRLLRRRRERLAVAESCTGGLLGKRLTDVSGASDFFTGGVICYSDAVKQEILGVPSAILAKYGAVSSQVAQELAHGARDRLKVEWGLAITGVAGPSGGRGDKPVGTVFLALEGANSAAQVQQLRLYGDRGQIRRASAQAALDLLRRCLLADSAVE